jgi:hypothetical protein
VKTSSRASGAKRTCLGSLPAVTDEATAVARSDSKLHGASADAPVRRTIAKAAMRVLLRALGLVEPRIGT